ncbi:MAG: hypothetical protein HYU64_17770 [Armatimonadetes bacterium]|nr:hypothetical protein [Armatimonadota bacterium]
MKRQIPLVIAFIAGVVMLGDYFIPHRFYRPVPEMFLTWMRIIQGFAVVLGIGSLAVNHLNKISKGGKQSFYSWVLLGSFLVTVVFGLLWKTDFTRPAGYIFRYFYTPLSATMFALLAFFIASAAFRAFRLKNVESGLLLITASLVMIGRIPLGNLIWKYVPGISNLVNLSQIQEWLTLNPVTAAQRTILMGAALGAIAVSLKILAGIDRSYFGGGE